jgi:hypothetical protein
VGGTAALGTDYSGIPATPAIPTSSPLAANQQGGTSSEPTQLQIPVNSLKVGGGDGSFISIQEAINSAASGATIWVAPGIYFEDLILSKPVTLLGANFGISANGSRRNETIINGFIHVNTLANNVTIDGFSLSPRQDNWQGSNLRIDAPISKLKNNIVTSGKPNGGYSHSGFVSYDVQRQNIEIANNLFKGIIDYAAVPNVIRIFGSDKATLSGNVFLNTGGGGNIGTSHRFDSLTIEGNLIIGGGEGLFYYNQPAWIGEISQLQIRNNTILDSRRYGINIGERASVRTGDISGNIIMPTSNLADSADLATDQFINIYVKDSAALGQSFLIAGNQVVNPWNPANRIVGVNTTDANTSVISIPASSQASIAANQLHGTSAGAGAITFAAGSATAALTVDPTADATVEPDETVALSLAAGSGYIIGTSASVVGTITNDDAAIPPGAWSYNWANASPLGNIPSILKASVAMPSPRAGEQPLALTALRVDLRDPAIQLTSTGRRSDWANNTIETTSETSRQYISRVRSSSVPIVAAMNTAPFELNLANQFLSVPTNIRGFAVSEGLLVSSTDYNTDTFKSTFLYDPITGARIQNMASSLPAPAGVTYPAPAAEVALASTLKVATSGFGIVLNNGVVSGDQITQNARSALGLTADGRYLTMLAVDRAANPAQANGWQGATDYDVGTILRGFGSSMGINLDGGGSTQLAWWNPASNQAELLSNPLAERYVGASLGVLYQSI